MSLLSLQEVNLSFNQRTVLSAIDFSIGEAEICTIIGPNGAGKSTLVKIMIGLLQPDSGQVKRQADLRIGYVPQKLHLDRGMPLNVKRFLALTGASKQEVQATFQQFDIKHLATEQIHGLSGGELQRVLLARAVLRKPQLLVLDEPLQGVDVIGQAKLYRLIASLREQLNCAIIMVSHDLHLVMAQTDSVLCLNQHVCCHGEPESVSRHPEYLRLFGGAVAEDLAVYTHHHDHQHDLHGNILNADHSACSHD
ncbi:zinc transport system ATP-binding protein [Alteromonadaceae bacterium Bs31]|nr:zinc transport system ATP-binding protein [Alteromonadaceae bacterium Bs31]